MMHGVAITSSLSWLARVAAFALLALAPVPAWAQQTAAAATPTPVPLASGGTIRLGMVTALSGPAKDLGINMRAGVLAAFEEANRAGGINGRTLELKSADDGYEGSRTGPQVRALIDQEGVIAFIGNVGTPTGVVTMPICKDKKVPFIAPFTGAASLRPTPPDPMVFHFRAGYHEEIGAMVDALLDHAGLKPTEIAFFTQRDAYGDAGFAGGLAAFKRRAAPEGFKPLHVRYERNTLDIESALAECLSARPAPKAVIMVGAYAPCGQFIRMARESGFSPLFLNVSFVGAEALAKDLGTGPAGEGVIVTQVVPTLDVETPLTKEFAAHLAALPKEMAVEPCLGALEGYLAGKMACLALAKCKDQPTAASFAAALEGLGSFDLGLGTPMSLSATDHQASHTVWPSVLRAGRVVALDWKDLANMKK